MFNVLHLHDQPVLCANLLNHLDCALTPVEIFFLVSQIGFQNVEGEIVLAYRTHALAQQLHTRLLNLQVLLDVLNGVVAQRASLVLLHLHLAAQVEDAVDELLYPFHLLRVVADVLLAQLREALSLENLSLYLVYECAL